jgi:outer membrane protein assembly factor BamB
MGSRLVIVGMVTILDIPGAADGSGLVLGGFNYVPITVVAANITVLQSIAVTPQVSTVAKGGTRQFTATGTYSDASALDITTQVTWSSSDTSKATVSATGLVSGVDSGSPTITATLQGISGSTTTNVFQTNPSPSPPLSQSVAYQIDYAHSGSATVGSPITFPSSPAWSVTLNGPVSYPLIADGKVFVITGAGGSPYGTTLYALDQQTGNNAWGPVFVPGTYFWAGLAYDHGKVFVINFDGVLSSFDAATGQAGWSAQMPGQYAFSSPPTAVNGVVYVGGAGVGGTLYAVDESNGNVLWTASVENGDNSSPTVSTDGVFVSYPCQVYKFDPISGSPLWHNSGGCEGGGGRTSVYANGLLYVRDEVSTVAQVLDATTGTQVGTFNAPSLTPAPAFSTQSGFFQSMGTLQAIDLASHNPLWSFTGVNGDGGLVSAPLFVDQFVIVGSASGTVYALDATTGTPVWSKSAGAGINGPDEQNVSGPLTGFGVGEGYLVVPAGSKLTAWHITGP